MKPKAMKEKILVFIMYGLQYGIWGNASQISKGYFEWIFLIVFPTQKYQVNPYDVLE